MDKNENIHIKLEISRDPHTGSLNLMTKFGKRRTYFQEIGSLEGKLM